MKKELSTSIPLLIIYIFLVIIYNLSFINLFLGKLPGLITYFSTTHQALTLPMRPFMTKFLFMLTSDFLKFTALIICLPLGCIFLLQRKAWARLLIIYSCLYLFLLQVYSFSSVYIYMVILKTYASPVATYMFQFIKDCSGINLLSFEAECAFIRDAIFTVLLFAIPITFLRQDNVTASFKQKNNNA